MGAEKRTVFLINNGNPSIHPEYPGEKFVRCYSELLSVKSGDFVKVEGTFYITPRYDTIEADCSGFYRVKKVEKIENAEVTVNSVTLDRIVEQSFEPKGAFLTLLQKGSF